MVCSQCQAPLHPYDLQRLFVPSDGGQMMVERIFCEACATALRRMAQASNCRSHSRGIPEPDWYRFILTV